VIKRVEPEVQVEREAAKLVDPDLARGAVGGAERQVHPAERPREPEGGAHELLAGEPQAGKKQWVRLPVPLQPIDQVQPVRRPGGIES
jgi:hypothetical protein